MSTLSAIFEKLKLIEGPTSSHFAELMVLVKAQILLKYASGLLKINAAFWLLLVIPLGKCKTDYNFQLIPQSEMVNRQTVYCGPNSDVYSSTNVRIFIPESFDNLFGI